MTFLKKKIFQLDLINSRHRIIDQKDLILFDEAIKCISCGAYRAAYVLIWITAAESLRAKIQELSLRDVEAGKAMGAIEKCERDNKSVDSTILNKSKDLGILNKDEHFKLDHIREMRNLYAHPVGLAPSVEELMAAFQQVCDYVLNRPAQLKHGYVNGLMNSIFQNRHFIDDDEEKIHEYAVGVARRLHPEILPYYIKQACEFYDQCTEDIIKRRAIWLTTRILHEMNPDFGGSGWDIIAILDKHPRSASLFLSDSEMWGKLPIQARDMCFGHLIEPISIDGNVTNPSPTRLRRLIKLRDNNCLTEVQGQKLKDLFLSIPYEKIIAADVKISDIFDRIIRDLKSHDWYTQNPTIDAIKSLGINKINELNESAQEELGRNILQVAEGNSGSAGNFIEVVLQKNKLAKSFVRGLLQECFTNERFEFRVKKKKLLFVFHVVLFQTESGHIIDAVIKDIQKSKNRDLYSKNEIDDVLSIIDFVYKDSSETDKVNLKKIKSTFLAIRKSE